MPGCHHSRSVVIDSQSVALQLVEGPSWGLIDKNIWRSNYGKRHLDYKYWEFVRTIWLLAWSRQLFDNLKTLRWPLEIRSCLGEAFLANTVVINQAAGCERDQPASLATCSSNRRLFALAAGNQLLVAHWLSPVPLPIKRYTSY